MTSENVTEDLFVDFKKNLSDLRSNDKLRINALTYFASDHKSNEIVSKEVVKLTTAHVFQVTAQLKLVSLYVIDSILKNVGDPFKALYYDSIVGTFVHAFKSIKDEKGRMSLYKLRVTWKVIYSPKILHQLDEEIHKIDAAWPVLPISENTSSSSTKIHVNPLFVTSKTGGSVSSKSLVSGTDSGGKPQLSTDEFVVPLPPPPPKAGNEPSTRDPRLQKGKDDTADQRLLKRKVETTEDQSVDSPPDEFLIDRAGDDKMEKKARKKGREENKKENPASVKDKLFIDRDQDMRDISEPFASKPEPSSPTSSQIWSNYREGHSDLTSRRSTFGDTDLRYEPMDDSFEHMPPQYDMNRPSHHNRFRFRPRHQGDWGPRYGQWGQRLPPRGPHPFRQNAPRPISIPRPKMELWNVPVEGLDDMPNIGIDPRLLSTSGPSRPTKIITVDGVNYDLILDRIHPLVLIGDQMHAIRFQISEANIIIDSVRFVIPCSNFCLVTVRGITGLTACLGGPGHELILDGKPYTVPFSGAPTMLTIGNNSVCVQFKGPRPSNVDVLPAIPPQVLKWAAQGLFGSPKNLNIPPSNPIIELAKARDSPFQQIKPPVPPPAPPMPPAFNNSTYSVPVDNKPSVDIYSLFDSLLAAGIVKKEVNNPTLPPDLISYSLEKFKIPFEEEEKLLYSGHQCAQCGLRFESPASDAFTRHLDYHYLKNTTEQVEIRSRNYYQSARRWLISEEECSPQFEDGTGPVHEECRCIAFEGGEVCGVCFEAFERCWDDEEEEWMLRDAVKSGEKAYHPVCLEDADKFTESFTTSPTPATPDTPGVDLREDPLGALQRVLRGQMSKVAVTEHNGSQDLDLDDPNTTLTEETIPVKQEVVDSSSQPPRSTASSSSDLPADLPPTSPVKLEQQLDDQEASPSPPAQLPSEESGVKSEPVIS